MPAFRLCRANFPAYDGEGAYRVGGRWNSAVIEILVHLAASLPDRYVLGVAEIPDAAGVEVLDETRLPSDWSTLDPRTAALGGSFRSVGHSRRTELRPESCAFGLPPDRLCRTDSDIRLFGATTPRLV
jgi:hypothetical protein